MVFVFAVQSGKKDSVGVRMALGETQIVTEIRQFLVDNGVVLDSFSNVSLFAVFIKWCNSATVASTRRWTVHCTGSGCAFWCTAAFTAPCQHISPTASADVDDRRHLHSSVSDTLVMEPIQHSAAMLTQWLHRSLERLASSVRAASSLSTFCQAFLFWWSFTDLPRPVTYWHCIQCICCQQKHDSVTVV